MNVPRQNSQRAWNQRRARALQARKSSPLQTGLRWRPANASIPKSTETAAASPRELGTFQQMNAMTLQNPNS